MPALTVRIGALVAVAATIAVLPANAQQQVIVTVAAVPNSIQPGGCARIVTDVRDELNRQLMPDNGTPLQWSFASGNNVDFEWRSPAPGETELCAKVSAAAVTTQVTATITGMPYSGTTSVAVGPTASPAAVPTQPYVPPAQPYSPAAAGAPAADPSAAAAAAYSPPAAAAPSYSPPQAPAATYSAPQAPTQPAVAPAQPTAAAPQPVAVPPQPQPVAPPPPPQVASQPVKGPGGFFKKLGSHIKQRAAEVKAETSQNLTAAATQIVDTTFQTGAKLVASTTAEVSNTARMGIGGVGQKLMLVPQRSSGSADNLALAVSTGRAVLPEVRFTPGTAVLEPSGRELVNRLGVELRNEMARLPGALFEIYAHVDSGPSAQVLSEERAAAVKAILVNYADAKRLTALGYGASQPVPGVPASRVEVVRCNDGQTQCSWR